MTTRCGEDVSGCFTPAFSTSNGSGRGQLAPSKTEIAITGALCLSCISFPNWHLTSSSDRRFPVGTATVNTYTVPLLLPAQNVFDIV